jgi:hypothetical protein
MPTVPVSDLTTPMNSDTMSSNKTASSTESTATPSGQ